MSLGQNPGQREMRRGNGKVRTQMPQTGGLSMPAGPQQGPTLEQSQPAPLTSLDERIERVRAAAEQNAAPRGSTAPIQPRQQQEGDLGPVGTSVDLLRAFAQLQLARAMQAVRRANGGA